MFFSVFEGVPQIKIEKTLLEKPIAVEDFLAEMTEIFPSKSEVRRMLKDNAISVNKSKIDDTYTFHMNL